MDDNGRQILYIHEHNIKDVCKIGIGTIDRAQKAYQYQNNDKDSQKNKLAIFSFENTDAITIEKICKQVLKRINSTEFYVIEFYRACLLFTLLGGKLDETNSQYIDRSKISVKIATPSAKNTIPLSERFADLIKSLVENHTHIIDEVKRELNNSGKRNVLLTKDEFDIYNKDGNRTGWKSYKEQWYYRTGVDATTLSSYIKILERKIFE
ncbi:hypothetical protein KJ980_04365 [Patescibacteria group bacterium]|nr:hypothetical protein [Patescibacteria group bacterium]MBU4015870.1 hypothetical protein [Patescibacteria group bacterium]MBU4098857.1 hypothetical protein [Patescibacteria group bacterium]